MRAHGGKCPTLPMSGWISQHGGGIGQTREISHGPVTMSACLPPSHPGSPARVQLHQAFDIVRVPVELEVLIDCDSVSDTTSCFEALVVLLGTHGIRTWRYSDDGPPADCPS